jgi:hypothetical protein
MITLPKELEMPGGGFVFFFLKPDMIMKKVLNYETDIINDISEIKKCLKK